MPPENAITFVSKISPLCFIRFGFFDSYRLRKKWKMPLLVTGGFLALALLARVCTGRLSGAETWMNIALVIAAAIPVMNVSAFWGGLLNQIGKHQLSRHTTNYLVVLGPKGVGIIHKTEHAHCSWEHVYRIYRVPGCIYLYVSADRAFLLPDAENTEDAWAMITAYADAQKIVDLRKQ